MPDIAVVMGATGGLGSAIVDAFANRTGKLNDAVSAVAHPMIATSLAASSLGSAYRDGFRFALAQDDGVVVGEWRDELVPRLREAEIVAHDYKALPRLTQLPAEDTMIAAYLIEPGRPAY